MPSFSDPEKAGISYKVAYSNGEDIPLWSWMRFDTTLSRLTGAPNSVSDGTGRYEIRLTATDKWGASTYDDFVLAITNTTTTLKATICMVA